MDITITPDSTSGFVSLNEAKTHLKILSSTEDDYITTLIDVATAWCENETDLVFADSTVVETRLAFTGAKFALLKRPVTALTSVTLNDEADTNSTLVKSTNGFSYLWWRNAGVICQDAIVTYTTALNSKQLPVAKHLVKIVVAELFLHRQITITGTIATKLSAYQYLIENLRMV